MAKGTFDNGLVHCLDCNSWFLAFAGAKESLGQAQGETSKHVVQHHLTVALVRFQSTLICGILILLEG